MLLAKHIDVFGQQQVHRTENHFFIFEIRGGAGLGVPKIRGGAGLGFPSPSPLHIFGLMVLAQWSYIFIDP
jgi:hypothetical protein